MRLVNFIKIICFVTVLSLVYIHLQMTIFTLAYQRIAKEKQIQRIIEKNGYLTHDILTLKSANHLGIKMLTGTSGMQFINHNQIIEVKVPKGYLSAQSAVNKEGPLEKIIPSIGLLSLGTQAEARSQDSLSHSSNIFKR